MRQYTLTASRLGSSLFWLPRVVQSQHRIRETLVYVFRAMYGRNPDKMLWGKDGFMGQARDRRGNEVMLEQANGRELGRRPTLAYADPGAAIRYRNRGPRALIPATCTTIKEVA